MIGEDRDVRQDADDEPDRARRLNARQVGAHIGDAPGAPGGFERMYGPLAVETALLKYGEGHRITADADRKAAARDPAQPFRPRRDSTGFAFVASVALDQRKVELAAREIAAQANAG